MNRYNSFEFDSKNEITNLKQLGLNNIFNNKKEKIKNESFNINKPNFKTFNYNNKNFILNENKNTQLNQITNDYLNFYFNNKQNNYHKLNENSNNFIHNLNPNFTQQNDYNHNVLYHNEISFFKYREINDLNNQIQNYSNQYNKLRDDDLNPRKTIQNKLLNKINQRLLKINNENNDNIYQENISSQWQQDYMLHQLDDPKLMYLYYNIKL